YICFWSRIIDARYYVPFKFNAVKSMINTVLLFVMSWLIIKDKTGWQLWLILLFGTITVFNYKSLLSTVKKVLRK
ncbi:MAG: capsular biosynthesis protein, partial [Ruminococcus sp.]|nr:capsular biosynthesis protein [Ruminococcus sp.]